jgi:uncharacterized protein
MFFFASDLHGSERRYESLLAAIGDERPEAVLLGGDLLPFQAQEEFTRDLAGRFSSLRTRLGSRYPRVLLIFGNDDPRALEPVFAEYEAEGLWTVLHNRCTDVGAQRIYGYPYVPPTPFMLKDWERYDVSHYVDPGCISPEEGFRSVPIEASESRYSTIALDLERLAGADDLTRAILLLHAPPYQTKLDRAALDGKSIDHAPLDVNVGSIALRRFIEARQPLITLHGHVHESARLTGTWKDHVGRTLLLGAAHDGPELALVRFEPEPPHDATRELM